MGSTPPSIAESTLLVFGSDDLLYLLFRTLYAGSRISDTGISLLILSGRSQSEMHPGKYNAGSSMDWRGSRSTQATLNPSKLNLNEAAKEDREAAMGRIHARSTLLLSNVRRESDRRQAWSPGQRRIAAFRLKTFSRDGIPVRRRQEISVFPASRPRESPYPTGGPA